MRPCPPGPGDIVGGRGRPYRSGRRLRHLLGALWCGGEEDALNVVGEAALGRGHCVKEDGALTSPVCPLAPGYWGSLGLLIEGADPPPLPRGIGAG